MQEILKPIPGFEGYYEASSNGYIKSVERKLIQKSRHGGTREVLYKSKILEPYKRKYKRSNIKERLQIVLSKNGETKSYDVHRLIAITFIENPNNYDTVNHKDGDTFNNHVENLEWVTKAENNRHAFKNNLVKTQKLIAQINPITKKVIKVYPGESEACRRMGVKQGKIRKAMQNNWKLRSFNWEYIDINDERVTTIEPWLGNQAVE